MSFESHQREYPLDERQAAVLRALIYEYIVTGKPVGSRSFVQKYSFTISPATMRNIMYDLERLGYLMQPHTSAGRVPTDVGYRFYVDSLLDTYELAINENIKVREELIRREFQMDKMFTEITHMLSLISKYAGVVLTPKPDFSVVKHIELIPLDENEILIILVTRTGMIIDKKVKVSTKITLDDLRTCSNYLTSELRGYSIFEIKNDIFTRLRDESSKDYIREIALDIAQLALTEESEPKLIVDGIENLLHIPEMIDEDRLRGLLKLIEEKRVLKEIMERNLDKVGVCTLIGEEIIEKEVSGCSIIASSYQIGNRKVGVVGIIGPTRMDYEKVVPLVDYTGRVVTDLLTRMSK